MLHIRFHINNNINNNKSRKYPSPSHWTWPRRKLRNGSWI